MKKLTAIILTLIAALSLSACGNSQKDVDLDDVFEKIEAAVTLPGMFEVEEENMEILYGIDPADIDDYVAYVSRMSTGVDEIVMVRAVDSKAAERVRDALQLRLDSQYEINKTYLPDLVDVLLDAEVSQNGNYVRLFVSADADTMISIYNEAFK